MTSLNIVFAGTPEFGLPAINAIADSPHQLSAVFTQPDRPAGRGRKLEASAIKQWALQQKIPVFQPVNLKDRENIELFKNLNPDVLVVIAYGLILPRAVLFTPTYGCINVHASLLPRWRGASPIQQTILAGDNLSGVTIMQMDKGMDTGDCLLKVDCPVNDDDTAATLHNKLAQLAVEPLLATLKNIANNTINPCVQNHNQATYTKKINKQDALIDWQKPATVIERQIRGYNPWPIAYTYAGTQVLRIHRAYISDNNQQAVPGTVLALTKQGLMVATSTQVLAITHVQFSGGKVLTIADYLNAPKDYLKVNMVLT